MKLSAIWTFGLAAGVVLGSIGRAATYDEAIQGDLSGDGLFPTPLSLDTPSNLLSGSVNSPADRDYFTITVAAGSVLTEIVLTDYQSLNARAFIGFMEGSSFTVPPTATSPDGLLGYMHFGIDQTPPSNLLDDLATSNPPGFTTPLPAGEYSFWINQTETTQTSYQFDFRTNPVPEPGVLVTALGGVGVLLGLRRRRA